MASSFGGSSDDDLIAGINVTPLVDVVLVLLVIFLITAPVIYQSAIKVQLPKAKSGEQAEKSPLSFSITREGDVAWGGEKIDWMALSAKLAETMKSNPDQTAVISADEATPHGSVIRLMDALRQAGLTRFALNVDSAPAK
jgi:biopolymer transport protein ExbD